MSTVTDLIMIAPWLRLHLNEWLLKLCVLESSTCSWMDGHTDGEVAASKADAAEAPSQWALTLRGARAAALETCRKSF